MTRISTAWRWLRTWVRNHRAELALAVRVTIAALSSFAVSHVLGVPLPLWTVLTAVILTQVNFGKSLRATINYLVGTLGGSLYAGAIAVLLPDAREIAHAGTLALAVGPLALLAAIYPSFNVATFTGVLVLLVPGIAHVSPVESAIDRVFEVAVGGGTALAVSFLVLPMRAHALAVEASAQMLERVAESVPALFAGFVEACDATAISHIQGRIGESFARLDALVAEARQERIGFLFAAPDLGALLRTLLRLRHDLLIIGRCAGVPLPETLRTRLEPALRRITSTAVEYLRRSGQALAARGDPMPLDGIEAALNDYADRFSVARREGLTRDLPADAAERVFALGFALDQVRQHLPDLECCVREARRR